MSTDLIITHRYSSPAGELVLGSFGERLCMCRWACELHPGRVESRLRLHLGADIREGTSEVIEKATVQLNEYFNGLRKAFDIPLRMPGTPFQQQVWDTLTLIPYGSTVGYGRLARMTGNARAVRAVSAAVGANAVSVLVPCHRVVGADGSLTGFAGGLEAKAMLLEFERDNATQHL